MTVNEMELPLLGREKPLGVLRKTMDDIEASKGSFIIIDGEAGVGKTAIIRKAERDAKERGWAVMSSECIVVRGADPYLPIITAVKCYLEDQESAKNAKARTRYMDMKLPMGLMATASQMDLEGVRWSIKEIRTERDRMFENILDLIKDASKGTPVLLSIDDLHWADTSALQLLYYIIQSTTNDRVLVLGAYRTEELENPSIRHPLTDVLWRLKQGDLVAPMHLEGLNQNDTARLVKVLSSVPIPEKLIKKIHRDTNGNPFFIKEFMREVQGKERLDAASLSVPFSVAHLIKNRLKGLDIGQQELLHTCAVLGQYFSYDLLKGVANIDEDELVNELDGLIAHKVLEERTRGPAINYAFTHSLLGEVIYDGLSTARKRLLHAKAGENLEHLFEGRLDQAVYQLAYHYSRTTMLPKAFKYTGLAGLISYHSMAIEEARQYLEDALGMLPKLGPEKSLEPKVVDLLSALGRVHNLLGNTERSLECHRKIMDMTEEFSVERAYALTNIAEVQMEKGQWKDAVETLKTALAISKKLNDRKGIAEGYRGLAWVSIELGDQENAFKYAEMGLKEAQAIKDRYLQGKILIDLGNHYNSRHEIEKALYYYEEALKVLDHNKHLDQLSRAYNNIGDIYMKLEKWDQAMDCFNNSIEVAKVMGYKRYLAYGWANMALCLGTIGKREEALQNLENALREFERTGDKYGITIVHMDRASIEGNAGNFKAAEESYKKCMALCEADDFNVLLAHAMVEYGVLLKKNGRKDEALAQLDKVLKFKARFITAAKIGGIEKGIKELMELKK
jgi:predicted ATPase